MILTCSQMQAAEKALFATGVEARPLMEKAGLGCAEAIRQFFPGPGLAMVFAGRGHNGGDALVAGRWLRARGWQVVARLTGPVEELAPLTRLQWELFEEEPEISGCPASPDVVVIDGLLGIGARGPLRESLSAPAREMARLRALGARVFAIDIPSGVDGDSGEPHPGAVTADVTLAIGHLKTGLLEDRALDHVGRLVRIPLPEIVSGEGDASRTTLHAESLREWLPVRSYGLHKSAAGRVGIVAGSPGMTGAACLAALGALRGGAGLVTVYCHPEAFPVVASKAAPEVMVRPFDPVAGLAGIEVHALGVGPGLGEWAEAARTLVTESPLPVVVDADSLNDLARVGGLKRLEAVADRRLVTPHPGELARLWPGAGNGTRLEVTRAVVERHGVVLLHKGSRTLIGAPGQPVAYNSTGHPGMATGGIGDVLTGLCSALAAGGVPLYQAACLGSWLVGYAAELALLPDRAGEGVSAGDVAGCLPCAIRHLRRGVF
ncbi:MAG: NAD(P)H-hydrate dehydratase [Verrucomicrobia bacterium]|nr:NAD(P)H-hydrate dehydratase [Verrucomicrobiota bacterium]